jgi:heavy metal sensor kinase
MTAWPSTLRWRLTLWYTVLLAVPLVALSIGYYALFARTLADRTDRFIGDALTAFSRELAAERRASLTASAAIRNTVSEVRFRELHIAVLDSGGAVVAMTPVPPAEQAGSNDPQSAFYAAVARAVRTHAATDSFAVTVRGRAADYRVIARPIILATDRFELTGAYSAADVEEILGRIRNVLVILIPLLVLGAASGGYLLAKHSLAPLSAMAARATEISATNLRERLPVSGGQELSVLARVVNDLLDRLERSFVQQRRFMTDASHELRTPTAILRTEADVTLAQAHRGEDEYRASMTIVRDAARRLTRIVDDLFVLARSDTEHVEARRAPLHLEELVHDAARAVRPLAEARNVRVDMGDMIEAPLRGDADLLGRLLLNLLDNAIKHSPDAGVVTIAMSRSRDRFDVTVADEGPGIPSADRDRIFERLVRLDTGEPANNDSATGAGLGLAIARRIAEAHGGSVVVADSRKGCTVFRLSLPAA